MSAWVERAAPERAEEIIALNRTCFSTPWSPQSIIKDMAVHDYYIVTEGGEALGYACVWSVPPEAELNDICVYPSARRRGFGQLLLSYALSQAKKQGVTMMSLEVRASNAAAIALYQKNDFVCEGIRRAYYTDDREDALILRRRESEEFMSHLSFDFTNMAAVEKGITKAELDAAKNAAPAVLAALESKRSAHTWRALPDTPEELISDMEREGARINRDFEAFVVLGIGGSALGSRAMFTALKHLRYNELPREKRGVRFYVADNIDPDGLSALFDVIDPEKTAFHVITKSGNTVETVAQFMLAASELKKRLKNIKNNVIVTTDSSKGNVKRIADEGGFKTYVVPDGVGGRFSVFCPVGLLSAAVLGIDIRAMLAGAACADKLCSRSSFNENPALMYAALTCAAMKRGANINVMMPYADALKDTAEWFCQLWAESLGKRFDNGGNIVNVGQTPVRALGVTDQHSQIQLYSEGPFDKLITFIGIERFERELEIPAAPMKVYDAEYLAGQSFNKLIASELYATRYALTRCGKMNMLITLDRLDAQSFGELIMFFEIATAAAGEYLDINAFDQPGVEEGKLATFALMGRAGYEKKAEEMTAAEKEIPYLIITKN